MKKIKIESRLGTVEGFGNDEMVYFDKFDIKSDKVIRHFILLNEGMKIMFEPFGWKDEWYIDLVKITQCEDDTIELADMYIDIVVEGNGPKYRIVDLEEYGEAVFEGKVTLLEMKHQMLQVQKFLNKYLHHENAYPPELIRPYI